VSAGSLSPLCRVTGLLGALGLAACGGDGTAPDGGTPPSPPPPPPPGAVGPAFSTFLGGSEEDQPRDVALDAAGNVYVTGGTLSPDYPVTSGAFRTTHNAGASPSQSSIQPMDVFVTKLGPGGAIAWSTFVGGRNYDRAYGIEVDDQGFVYIAGRAGDGFPVTGGALQTAFRGGQEAPQYGPQDGFVCKIRPDGGSVVFCTYFGSTDSVIIRDLAVDSQGNIYVASAWDGGTWPPEIGGAFTNSPHGGVDAVVAKISPDGSQVLWATYLGGSGTESHQNSVRVDGAGNPYVLLTTSSANAPTTAGVPYPSYSGGGDLYVARLDPGDGGLVWATYVGGSQNESTETHEFAVDRSGRACVAAPTKSQDLPTTSGAVQPSYGGGNNDMFATCFSSDGATVLGSTYLGGSGADRPEGVAMDDDGHLYFTGVTSSDDFPVSDNAYQPNPGGGDPDVAVVMLPLSMDRVLYASYLGRSGFDAGRGAAAGAGRVFVLVGQSDSSDFPVLHPLQSYGGGIDGIVVRFEFP